MNYRTLGASLNLSEASVKRIFSQRTFTLERLEQICDILEVDFYELAKVARGPVADLSKTLHLDQETALAQDRKLFAFFYILISGRAPQEISRDFLFSERETQQNLKKLEELKLILRMPNDRIKILVSNNVKWLEKGPLNTLYEKEIKTDFLEPKFSGLHERLRLLTGHFSERSIRILETKVEKLISEFIELSETDTLLEPSSARRLWLLVAYRPWNFSVIKKYRRN